VAFYIQISIRFWVHFWKVGVAHKHTLAKNISREKKWLGYACGHLGLSKNALKNG